jgi:ribose-phosphate pyrophosphokinase
MRIFSGTSHFALGKALAKELNVHLGDIDLKRFSCGECYVKFKESVRGKDIYLLQAPGLDPDNALMELLLMCQAARLSFARSVHVILPNFPYARQDRVAEPREPISAKLVAHILEEAGADHVMTLMLHSDQIQGFFTIPVDSLDARPIFAQYFNKKKIKNPIVVAPDIGGAKPAKRFADLINADIAVMHKNRDEHHKAEILDIVGDVEGRTCIIYDDMVDTAGSIVAAKDALIKAGAHKDVYVAATHPIFSGEAVKRLKKAKFKEVVVTDTMPIDKKAFAGLKVLSTAPLLARVIRNIERGESVTDIYK